MKPEEQMVLFLKIENQPKNKNMNANVLQSTIELPRVRFELNLPIIPLPRSFGYNGFHYIKEEMHGIVDDGITGFAKTLQRAVSLLPNKDAAQNVLFTTDKSRKQTTSNTFERIEKLRGFSLADPCVIWSMYKEKDQITLRFLHENLGVSWIQTLRRTLAHRKNNGSERFFSLMVYRDSKKFLWVVDFEEFYNLNHRDIPVLLNETL